MKPSREYVRQKFDEYNKLMFAGRLPELKIELMDSGRTLGMCVSKVKRYPDGHVEHSDFRLRINTRVDFPEQVVEDTIIHEMIHYFIGINGLIDSSAHGYIFKSVMDSINRNYNRHLTVSHKSTPEEREQFVSDRRTWHVIAVLHFRSGQKGVKVLPRVVDKIAYYHRSVKASGEVVSVDLYLHDSPYFNRYPTSAALKYHVIESDILAENLIGARPLRIEGDRLIDTTARY